MDAEKVEDLDGVDDDEDECMGRLLMTESLGEADADTELDVREECPSNFDESDKEEYRSRGPDEPSLVSAPLPP